MTLRDDDHVVLVKLHDEILDWFFAAEIAGRSWFVRLADIRGYGGEIAAVLVGLGLGGPLTAYIKGDAGAGRLALTDALHDPASIPSVLGACALVAWALLGVIAVRKDVVTRAAFARDFARSMRLEWHALDQVLRQAEPMAGLEDIQRTINQKVKEAAEKDILDWSRLAPNDDPERELARTRRTDYIRRQFMHKWAGRPNRELRGNE